MARTPRERERQIEREATTAGPRSSLTGLLIGLLLMIAVIVALYFVLSTPWAAPADDLNISVNADEIPADVRDVEIATDRPEKSSDR